MNMLYLIISEVMDSLGNDSALMGAFFKQKLSPDIIFWVMKVPVIINYDEPTLVNEDSQTWRALRALCITELCLEIVLVDLIQLN